MHDCRTIGRLEEIIDPDLGPAVRFVPDPKASRPIPSLIVKGHARALDLLPRKHRCAQKINSTRSIGRRALSRWGRESRNGCLIHGPSMLPPCLIDDGYQFQNGSSPSRPGDRPRPACVPITGPYPASSRTTPERAFQSMRTMRPTGQLLARISNCEIEAGRMAASTINPIHNAKFCNRLSSRLAYLRTSGG